MSELDGPGKRILPSGALEDGLFEDGQLIEGQAINVKTGTFLNSIFQ